MTDRNNPDKALAYSRRLIKIRPRTEKELQGRLFDKKFGRETIRETVSYLKKKNEINDLYFARLWIESRLSANPRGSKLLKKELAQKGVSSAIIDSVLSDMEYKESAIGRQFAESRIAKMGNLPEPEIRKKLFNLLARRGFDVEIIDNITEEALSGRSRKTG